ncbi:hypothetical protein OIU79_019369 [Salix purpurea]|uniref:Uncharacterized protein n=1 Tax=Salix purpurea TaxID=77065 RepID=A0A9Q0P107_SALPP|nr:hypothetical protein OIU79_019369 [Salix purpurea]
MEAVCISSICTVDEAEVSSGGNRVPQPFVVRKLVPETDIDKPFHSFTLHIYSAIQQCKCNGSRPGGGG